MSLKMVKTRFSFSLLHFCLILYCQGITALCGFSRVFIVHYIALIITFKSGVKDKFAFFPLKMGGFRRGGQDDSFHHSQLSLLIFTSSFPLFNLVIISFECNNSKSSFQKPFIILFKGGVFRFEMDNLSKQQTPFPFPINTILWLWHWNHSKVYFSVLMVFVID